MIFNLKKCEQFTKISEVSEDEKFTGKPCTKWAWFSRRTARACLAGKQKGSLNARGTYGITQLIAQSHGYENINRKISTYIDTQVLSALASFLVPNSYRFSLH